MSRRGENIYLRKDGRYEGRCRITSRTGETRYAYVYGRKYREVRTRLNQLRSQQAHSWDQYEDGRFETWMNHYLRDVVRHQVKDTTFSTYQNATEKRLIPEFGPLKLDEISDVHINRFYSGMLEEGLSETTARSLVRLLRAALRDACRKGYVRQVPECNYMHRPPAQPRVLSIPEQEKLTDAAVRCDALFCLIGLYAGLRVGEICALRWQDWQRESTTLCVSASVHRLPGQGLSLGSTKSGASERFVPVPEFLACLMNAHQSATQAERNRFIIGGGALPTDPRTLQRRLARLCGQVDLEGVHMHTLRHSYAMRMLEAGTDVKTLSALLGHSSVRITMERYCHTNPEQMRSAAQRFDRYIAEHFSRQ